MDFNLKHRITGAAILIALGVLVASIVLDEPGPPPADIARGPIDEQGDEGSFVSRVTPIGGKLERRPAPETATDAADAGSGSAAAHSGETPKEPAPGGEGEAAAADTAEEAQAEVPSTQPAPASRSDVAEQAAAAEDSPATVAKAAGADSGTADDEAAAEPAVPERGWVVRIGTYAQPGNVERLSARLREVGFEPRTSETMTDAGAATRVWVGPYEKRVDAARVRARLEKLIGQKGLITAYP